MNTILTDDEFPPLQPQDHPEPHSFAWTEQEMRAIRARDRLVEAAVLAKLREQEPITQAQAEIILGHGLDGLSDALAKRLMKKAQYRLDQLMKSRAPYAAPLPAVVQVPQLVAQELERIAQDPPISGNEIAQARVLMAARSIRDFGLSGGAAAPEAPAHPSVPAPWREAMKVAREALTMATIAMPLVQAPHAVIEKQMQVMSAAIAQLDSLEDWE